MTYFTPRFSGFQFAVSWTPDTQTDLGTNPVGTAGGTGGTPGATRFGTANEEETYTNAIDLGVHYSGEFEGVGITAQAGWGTVDTPDRLSNFAPGESNSDPNIYQAGLAISFEGFTVAGGWARMDEGLLLAGPDTDNDGISNGGLQRTDGHSWTIGAGYATGPWAAICTARKKGASPIEETTRTISFKLRRVTRSLPVLGSTSNICTSTARLTIKMGRMGDGIATPTPSCWA